MRKCIYVARGGGPFWTQSLIGRLLIPGSTAGCALVTRATSDVEGESVASRRSSSQL